MSVKEFVFSRLQLFFFLVTLILAASAVTGIIIAPEQELQYHNLLSPIFMAILCIPPTCVTYFKEEPPLKKYILRVALQLVLIESVVMFLLSPPTDGSIDHTLFYVLCGTVVFVIYVLAMLMMWLQKYQQSKKLTEQIKRLQATE